MANSDFMNDFMQGFNGGFSFTTNLLPLVLTILGSWKIFEKAGIEGWKALIPVYREYLIFDLAKEKKSNFWIYIGSYVALFVSAVGMGFFVALGAGLHNDGLVLVGIGFLALMLVSLGFMVVYLVRAHYKLFMLFGKEKGMAILFAIFSNIGLLITGFDSSVYEGNKVPTNNENTDNVHTNISNEKINFCSNCGSKVEGNFCQNCGNKIE